MGLVRRRVRRCDQAPFDARTLAWVLTLIAALVGAPATSALRNECELCPRTCPMHHPQKPAPSTHSHLGCHAVQSGAHATRPEHPRGPAVTRPACSTHGVVSAVVLPPVILSAVRTLPRPALTRAAPRPDLTARGRQVDPPDTRPPIGAA
jgi:hypothetical protein